MVLKLKPAVLLFYLLIVGIVVTTLYFVTSDDSPYAEPVFAEGKHILIIDAGHGGADGGAGSVTGALECTINLSISLKMRALAEFTATPYIMTRESETIDYPAEASSIARKKVWDQKQRVALINETPNAVLISVHQNTYPTSGPRGPHAFYGKAETADELAKLTQAAMSAALYPENRRVASPVSSDIYLFKNINCPSVLAECGFLSNDTEAQLLDGDKYQTKVAVSLMSAYFQYIDLH